MFESLSLTKPDGDVPGTVAPKPVVWAVSVEEGGYRS